jgi:hypothetical protein
MKGGVTLEYGYTNNTAFEYFMEHAECKILSDTSISCITYICEFKPDDKNLKTPYKSMRINNLRTPINKILLKIMLNTETISGLYGMEHDYIDFVRSFVYVNPDRHKIELNTIASIDSEIKIQQDLYKKSFLDPQSYFEPICPCIITYDHK